MGDASAAPAASVSPDKDGLHGSPAYALLLAGDVRNAWLTAKARLNETPNCADAHFVLGELALDQGCMAIAENSFRHARARYPHDSDITSGLAESLLAQGKLGEAGKLLLELDETGTAGVPQVVTAARLLLRLGQVAAASTTIQDLVAEKPRDYAALFRLGHAFKRAGHLREALESYRRALGSAQPIERLDPDARPLRIGFLLQVAQAWTSLESVWEAFRLDPRFITTIIACPNHPTNRTEGGPEAIFDFLQQRDVPFSRWAAQTLEPDFVDVLFVQSPYDHTRPSELRGAALLKLVPRIAYVPYALEIGGGAENVGLLTNLPLHQFAWLLCARSESHKRNFARHCAAGDRHVVVTGHPKIDALSRPAPEDEALVEFAGGRKLVLWNPHYDARLGDPRWGGGYSTFVRWWRIFLAEFARRPELALLIRPHPLLFGALRQRAIMVPAEIEEFRLGCAARPNVRLDGGMSYLPAFARSAALMSDASSFLLEYAATGKPILYLHNPHGPGLNADGEFITTTCAVGEHEPQIGHFLDEVTRGHDPGADARRRALWGRYLHRPAHGAGQAIKEAVLARIRSENALTTPEAGPGSPA